MVEYIGNVSSSANISTTGRLENYLQMSFHLMKQQTITDDYR